MNNEIINNRLAQLLLMLEKQPNQSFLHYALGIEYRKANRMENALECFRKTLEIDPNYLAAWYQLAEIQAATGHKEAARNSYACGINLAQKLNDIKGLAEFKNALLNLEIEG